MVSLEGVIYIIHSIFLLFAAADTLLSLFFEN